MIGLIWISIIAGITATGIMTAVMLFIQALQHKEHEYLPPEKITRGITGTLGIWQKLRGPGRLTLSMGAHFAFGIFCATLYLLLFGLLQDYSVLTGTIFGFTVWALNYVVLLPFLDILEPAHERSPRETAMLVPAHLAWGFFVGAIAQRMAV